MRLFATYLIFLLKFAFITYGAILPHQGRVLISGSAFEGTGLFRFALVEQSGAVVWNHEGGVGDPQNSLSIPVEKGFYQCRLGDTSIDGMAELPDTIFTPENPLKLRIWFDDGTNGLQRLGQDQNLMTAPYAMTSPRSESEKIAMRFADEIIRQAGTSNLSVDELIERISSFAQQATKQGTITKEMLPADIFAEMNKTVQMFHDSQSMISDLNRTLNQAVIAFNRPITKSMLGADVLADLNRTLSNGKGSVTTEMLSEDIIKYLRPEIVSQTTLSSLGNIYQGKNISLSLHAEGKFITYQWQKGGVNLEGQTSNNLILGSFTPLTQNGTYRAIVTNDFGSVLTEPVTLFFPVSPEDLNSTAPLTIRENLPAGTLVGQFTATDPDDGNLTFTLEDGESPDHAFFRLESNGTLFTSTTFDFENNKSSYSLIVGVNDQDGGVSYGHFTVFLLDGLDDPWRKITAPDKAEGDRFGTSVSISGDLLAVGTRYSDPDGVKSAGAVYVYRVEGNGAVVPIAKVSAPDKAENHHFGYHVSLSENMLLVGASGAASAYLFNIDQNGTVTLVSKLTAPDQQNNFGYDVSISGEYFSIGQVNNARNSVYVYRIGQNETVNYLGKISAPDADAENSFGYSISQSGNKLAVGAFWADPGSIADSGAVYIYQVEQNGTIAYLGMATAPDKAPNDKFGMSVSLADDLLVAGVPYADPGHPAPNSTNAGAAYLYHIDQNGSLTFLSKVTAPLLEAGEYFGSEVSLYDNNLAIGASDSDSNGVSGSGAVYLYRIEQNGSVNYTSKISFQNVKALGNSVSLSQKRLLAGALFSDVDGVSEAGSAYLYDLFLRSSHLGGNPSTHTVDLNSSVNLEMIWCPPGTFTMGSPTTEAGRQSDREDEHNVTLTKGFYLGKYEVTQAQYEAVMSGNSEGLNADPSWFKGSNRPVETVGLPDAQVFLTRLNDQQSANIPAGWAYVLPTEAEWEYACRAGTTTAYSWGNVINSSLANYNSDRDGGSPPVSGGGDLLTRDVGLYNANPWGFFDMHGNVWEWTASFYQAPSGMFWPMFRGGSWRSSGERLRSAMRDHDEPNYARDRIGFRIAYKFTGIHTVDLNSSVNLEMIWCPPGTFTMGSPVTEVGRNSNETEHNVTLTKGFYLGKYEVTQAQYEAVMSGNSEGLNAKPSHFHGYPNRPVEKVSWEDAQIFLSRLNGQEAEAGNLPAGWAYVLPTEAQWEYACRAGTTTVYSWGNTVTSDNANYNVYNGETSNVGEYPANAWGLYDMHGNVWELVADWYTTSPYGSNEVTDPTGPASGSLWVVRGGSWNNSGTNLRSAKHEDVFPGERSSNVGFRVGFQRQ
jgi:formylglycine-generating enzyme required for sulfatase activity